MYSRTREQLKNAVWIVCKRCGERKTEDNYSSGKAKCKRCETDRRNAKDQQKRIDFHAKYLQNYNREED